MATIDLRITQITNLNYAEARNVGFSGVVHFGAQTPIGTVSLQVPFEKQESIHLGIQHALVLVVEFGNQLAKAAKDLQ